VDPFLVLTACSLVAKVAAVGKNCQQSQFLAVFGFNLDNLRE
jgi:hypothetical protein